MRVEVELTEGQWTVLSAFCKLLMCSDGFGPDPVQHVRVVGNMVGAGEDVGRALLDAFGGIVIDLAAHGIDPPRFPCGSPWGMSSSDEVESAGA